MPMIDTKIDPVYEMTGYTEAELQAAFDLVKPKTHWKDPIDAVIDDLKRPIVGAAIEFYTATKPIFVVVSSDFLPIPSGMVRVVASGYRMGPAGDH